MSTSAEYLVAVNATLERRFYRRIAPSALVYIPFGENNVGMLLNVSENGLLVSTPLGLTRNFVYRVSLRLYGLPRAIDVRVRVVWTTESKQRAGIQLLDLREYDREQIRKWAALQGAREIDSEPPAPQKSIPPPQRPTVPPLAGAEPPKRPGSVAASMPLSRPVLHRTGATSAKSTPLAYAALIAALCLGIGLFFENGPVRKWLSRPASVAKENTAPTGRAGNPPDKRIKNAKTPVLTGARTDSLLNTAVRKGLESKTAAVKTSSSSKRAATINAKPNLDTVGPDATDSSSGQFAPNPSISESLTPDPTESSAASNPPATSDATTEKLSDRTSSDTSTIAGPVSNPPPPTGLSANAPPVSVSTPAAPPAPATFPRAALAPRVESAPDLAVVHMDVPESRVVEVTLPKGRGSSILGLPGERVLQSPSVTLRIQRSILVPAERKWWPSTRSRKVLLGEMLSRVDPQTPHFQVPAGTSVSVRAVLDKNGRVENLQPVNGSITLVPSVVRAVREWRYEPTLLDGKPVETQLNVLVQFHPPMDRASRP